MSGLSVVRRPGGLGWRWEASVRPPGMERITTKGTARTERAAYRQGRRELRRLLAAMTKGAR